MKNKNKVINSVPREEIEFNKTISYNRKSTMVIIIGMLVILLIGIYKYGGLF